MTYAQALAYLYERLPVFHRIGAKALKPGLANTERLCAALGDPQTKFPVIHVAGTNGKGSTSHMLASVYQAAGYKVGLYTSPHLKSFTERIRINGQPMGEEAVATFVTQHQALIESVEPSFFEVTVGMAFDQFAREGVDLAVIEVGLGGRLDSTNVVNPVISVITNIGLDHTDILGSTLEAIAGEKAGIIKPGVPVVIGATQPETAPVFNQKAAECQSPITFADQQFVADSEGGGVARVVSVWKVVATGNQPVGSFTLDLTGLYQVPNLLTVLATVFQLNAQFPVDHQALQRGLASVTAQTGLKGRFQTLQQLPRVIADTAHNQPGIQALLASIESISYQHLHLVVGFVADKDVAAALKLLPATAHYYFCQADSPRSLPVADLVNLSHELGLAGEGYMSVNQALEAALVSALPADLIVVTGSTYIVAELTNL